MSDGKPATFTINARVRGLWLLRVVLPLAAACRFNRRLAPLAVRLGNAALNRVRVQIQEPGARRWRDAGPLGMRLEHTP